MTTRSKRRRSNSARSFERCKDYAIFTLDPDGSIASWNEGAERIKGYEEDDILGEHISVFYTDDAIDRGVPEHNLEEAADRGRIEDEGWRVREDGSRFWANVVITAVRDDDGTLQGFTKVTRDMTEEHEREKERRAILERMTDAFYALDDQWRFTYINEQAEKILQRTEEELLGTSIWDLYPEAEETVAWDEYHEAMETNEPTSFELYYELLDIWAEINAYPGDEGLSVFFRDITERKEHERALEQYKTAVNVASDVFVTIDEQSSIQAVNPVVEDVFGYDPDELVGKPLTTLMSEPLRERHRDGIRRYLETDERNVDWAQIELPGQRKDGHEIPLAISFSEYEHGGDRFFVGLIRDNTERKAHERELEARIQQQQVVTDLGQRALENPDLDVLFDEAVEAVADTLDNAYCKVLDLHPDDDELLLRAGVGWKEGYVGEAAVGTALDSQAGYTLQSETPIVVEDLRTEERFSGPPLLTEHDVVSGISTIIGPYHEPWGVLGTHDTRQREFTEHDVNFVQSVANILASAIERKQFEERLSETVEKLEESNERLEQFAYVASHDLQEPLRMVSSYLQLLERRYADELDDDAQEFIDFAVDGAERMQAMIEDLLEYSRLGTRGNEFEPTDCNAVLEQTLESLRLSIEETDADIASDTLPTVMGDPDQLSQLFQNLISNAIKYRGDEPPRIAFEVDRRDDEWQFSVTDNGIGIDPGQTDRIFQIFNRLHSTDEYSGTGIGLAMCQKIVERHGGEIWVESEPGDGSTFSFTLPVAQTTTDDEFNPDHDR